MKFAAKVFLAITTAMTFAIPAHATVVIDPTNLIQNLLTALSAIKTESTTASALMQQTKGTIELVKGTAALGNLGALAGAQREFEMYNELRLNNSALEAQMLKSLQLTQGVQAKVGASKFSWDEFLNSKNESDAAQAQVYQNQYKAINQSMTTTATKRMDILDALNGAQGQTAATQAVGAQIDMLIGQNQQMISQLGSQKMLEGNRMDAERANMEAAKSINNAYQKRLSESSKRFSSSKTD